MVDNHLTLSAMFSRLTSAILVSAVTILCLASSSPTLAVEASFTAVGTTPVLNGDRSFSRYYSLHGQGYVVKFQKRDRSNGITRNKRILYRLDQTTDQVNLEELHTFTGGKYWRRRQDDDLFAFGGDLYFTVTRGTSQKTDLYR